MTRSTSVPTPDDAELYRGMARARAFELLLLQLWEEGRISGELHLGTGEEAVAVGVLAHLRGGDALALDHRSTPFLLLHGVDPVAMVREALGRPDGLCHGAGGHMHLMDPDRLAAGSGIVGASGPAGCGFALAAATLRPGTIAIATSGEGAMNQGMMLEALNLAAAWRLPLVFVCKDNDWAITTESHDVTAGDLAARARAFGVPAVEVDGGDPAAVRDAAGPLIARAREGGGPGFLLARCPRLDGHMAGFILDRLAHSPIREGAEAGLLGRVAASAVAPGAGIRQKAASVGAIARRLARSRGDRRENREDPLSRTRSRLDPDTARVIEDEAAAEMRRVRAAALADPPEGGPGAAPPGAPEP